MPVFKNLRHIGAGTFGNVFSCKDCATDHIMAMKTEEKKDEEKEPKLVNEFKIYKLLEGTLGFPRVDRLGETDHYYYLIFDLLGNSIDYFFRKCRKHFSRKTIVMLAIQFLDRLEVLHKAGYVHRDLKPDNLVMGSSAKTHSLLYLIDVGLGQEIETEAEYNRSRRGMVGTLRFAPLAAHLGKMQSKKDDLESAAYVLAYLSRGKLPWQVAYASNKEERFKKICTIKQDISPKEICKGARFEIQLMLEHAKSLKYGDTPDYEKLRTNFKEALLDLGEKNDGKFCWM